MALLITQFYTIFCHFLINRPQHSAQNSVLTQICFVLNMTGKLQHEIKYHNYNLSNQPT